jgi:hypothetical protein
MCHDEVKVVIGITGPAIPFRKPSVHVTAL